MMIRIREYFGFNYYPTGDDGSFELYVDVDPSWRIGKYTAIVEYNSIEFARTAIEIIE